MPTRDRTDSNSYRDEEGASPYPVPNGHYTAARFRERIRPEDNLRGGTEHWDPEYSMLRMLDGHILTVGPIADVQANHLCGPDDDLGVSTDNANWVE